MNVVAFDADVLHEVAHGLTIVVGNQHGFCYDGCFILHVDKAVRAFEIKFNFLFVEDVKDRDVVLAIAQVLRSSSCSVG